MDFKIIFTCLETGMNALCKYLFYMWRKYDVSVTFVTLMSCDSVCYMSGEACNSRWLMTQLTNMLVCLNSCQWWTFWTYLVTANLSYIYLMNFMFHTTLDAISNILRVHYKNMKCDVFTQGSVSTLFRWGERVILVCVKMFSMLTAVQKL